tara:strand:- start:2229 stop:2633 length:405 start_codon:yes stop_codon:yes gene_type:complete
MTDSRNLPANTGGVVASPGEIEYPSSRIPSDAEKQQARVNLGIIPPTDETTGDKASNKPVTARKIISAPNVLVIMLASNLEQLEALNLAISLEKDTNKRASLVTACDCCKMERIELLKRKRRNDAALMMLSMLK